MMEGEAFWPVPYPEQNWGQLQSTQGRAGKASAASKSYSNLCYLKWWHKSEYHRSSPGHPRPNLGSGTSAGSWPYLLSPMACLPRGLPTVCPHTSQNNYFLPPTPRTLHQTDLASMGLRGLSQLTFLCWPSCCLYSTFVTLLGSDTV